MFTKMLIVVIKVFFGAVCTIINTVDVAAHAIHGFCKKITTVIEGKKNKLIKKLENMSVKASAVKYMKCRVRTSNVITVDQWVTPGEQRIINTFKDFPKTITIIDRDTNEIIYNDRDVNYFKIRECVSTHNCYILSSEPMLCGIMLKTTAKG